MIKIENLSFSFDSAKNILKNINLEIEQHSSTALLGANGSGKTSLLFTIAGIYKFKGKIKFDGFSLKNGSKKELRDKIGVIFQNPDDQLFMPSVKEELSLTLLQKYNNVDQTKINKMLEKFQVGHLKESAPHQLSEGEKKKVALCSALIGNPEILILDEPTSHLDVRGKKEFIKTINSIEKTKIIATHDLPFARKCCERAVVLENGRITARGKFEEVISNEKQLKKAGLI
jgi:cobalt/nickel transport system ATP-binding protein